MQLLEERRMDDKRRDLSAIGSHMAFEVERTLDRSLASTYALATTIRKRESVLRNNFDSVAANLIETYGGVDSLQLAPGGVVSQIYPLEGNEAAIGHDLLSDPARRGEALAAIESRELTLAGPFTLVQGGVAMIGRLPVFIPDDSGEDRFWGFTIGLIRMPTLLDAAILAPTHENGYDFELSRVLPDTGQPDTFFRSSDNDIQDAMTFAIEVPNGAWTLRLAGANAGRPLWLPMAEVIPVVLIGALLAGVLYIYLLPVAQRRRAADALRESRERWTVVDNANDAIFMNVNGERIFTNRAYWVLLGLEDRSGEVGVPVDQFEDHILPEDRELVRERAKARLRGEKVPSVYEYRIRRPDGEIRDVETSVQLIEYEAQPTILAFLRDVTERKAAENALRESEERYRAVVDNSKDAIVVNQDLRRVFVNQAFLDIHGLDDFSQASGIPVDEFFLPEDKPKVRERALARQEAESLTDFSLSRIRKPDGEIRIVEATGARIIWRGRPASLGVLRDVTERVRTEEALAETEQRLKRVLGTLPIIAFALDRDGIFTLSEGRGLMATGLEAGEVVGQSIFDRHASHSDTINAVQKAFAGEASETSLELG